MSGIDTGEGRLGAPLPVHVAGDAGVVLSYRVCNIRIADNIPDYAIIPEEVFTTMR